MKTDPRIYAPLATILASTMAFASGAPALAGGVTAGTLIRNTATAAYNEGGTQRTVDSNTVTVRVDELLDATVTSLDPGPIAGRPGDAVLTFELTNQGNGPEAFRLVPEADVAGNDYDVSVRGIAIDSNGNGIYDEGVDQILTTPLATPILAADARLTVFVLVTVPQGVGDGDTSNVSLTAEALTGTGSPGTSFAGAGVGGGDAIVGTTGAFATARGGLESAFSGVTLTKSVVLRDPFGGDSAVPGATATFTIVASVSGSGSVANLVVSDAIPEGTTYVADSLALDAAPLSDADDADAGTASAADGIRVELGTAPAGARRAVTFDVTIDK